MRRRGRGGRGGTARAAAWPCADPAPDALFEHVYAGPHPLLEEERDAYAAYLADVRPGGVMATMSLGKALNAGLRQAMERDPKVVLMGEDIGKLGGVFRVTEGLQRDFGERRVIDTPLAESGVIGTAVGLAMRGYRPVCEIQFDGFVYPAFDQIVSQVAKLRYRNEGRVAMPMTIRVPYGGGIGAVEHHSESPEAYFAHTAGLRVVTPSSAGDGHRMIQQAIASDDPVVFFEPKRRYWEKGEVDDAAPRGADAAAPGPGRRRGERRHRRRLRPDGGHRARCGPDRRGGGNLHRGDRPALALADRLRHDRGVGPQDGPAGGRPRGVRVLRARGRDRSPGVRALLLPPRVARCAGSAASPRRTRRRGWSGISSPTPTASSTRWTGACRRERRPAVSAARPRRGSDRGRDRGLARGRR